MNNTIKNIALVAMALMSSALCAQFVNKDDALLAIKISKQDAFTNKENLMTQRISVANSDVWYALMNKVKDFVAKNDKDQLKFYDRVLPAATEILNTLKYIYNTQVAGAIINPADKEAGIATWAGKLDPNKLVLDPIKEELKKIIKAKADLAATQKSLKDKIFISPGARSAREVLLKLIDALDEISAKSLQDYEKLKDSKATLVRDAYLQQQKAA